MTYKLFLQYSWYYQIYTVSLLYDTCSLRIKDTGMSKTVEVIEYISGWKWDEDGGGSPMKLPVLKQEPVVMSHTKRYHNCLYLLSGLSRCAKTLMDYLSEEMNDSNIVYHTKESRKTFIDFVAEITQGKTVYADQSVKQAWAELSKSGLLIKRDTKATFKVHPKFFSKWHEKKRIDDIVAQISFNNKGVDNFKILPNKRLGL